MTIDRIEISNKRITIQEGDDETYITVASLTEGAYKEAEALLVDDTVDGQTALEIRKTRDSIKKNKLIDKKGRDKALADIETPEFRDMVRRQVKNRLRSDKQKELAEVKFVNLKSDSIQALKTIIDGE